MSFNEEAMLWWVVMVLYERIERCDSDSTSLLTLIDDIKCHSPYNFGGIRNSFAACRAISMERAHKL